MKRKFFGMLLMGAMTVASVGMFTSCKDYDDDINNLQKQIDGITAQKLQDQLNTLKSAAEAAKTAADNAQATANTAVANAKAAKDAADAAQGTADAANAAAKAAQAAADAAQATANAAATKEYADAIKKAIDDLTPIVEGKVSKADFDEAIEKVESEILAINETLLTLISKEDAQKLLDEADFAKNTVIQDLKSQVKALNDFKKSLEDLGPIGDADWQAKVDAAIAAIQKEINGVEDTAEEAEAVKGLKQRMEDAEAAIETLEGFGTKVDILNIFLKRDLKSLVLRPDTYYGGIEGVSVYIYQLPEEKNNPERKNDMYRYFDRQADVINISDYGVAQYHVNPSNVDLTDFSIDFYNHTAKILEPAAKEGVTPTRSGDSEWISADGKTKVNGFGIHPIYDNTGDLFAAESDDFKPFENGILSVPFEADAAKIEDNLKKGLGTIASLSMTKKSADKDTTVNSDYALIVPEYGYGLLIGDTDYEKAGDVEYKDKIGYDGGLVNSANLHRSFSFLALATTSPTHTIKFDESFDITEVLVSRYFKTLAKWEAVKDTAVYVTHNNHQAIAKWNGETLNIADDGDATVKVDDVRNLSAADFAKLGFKYDIQLVNYTLGSNKTGETVHLQLKTDPETGHVIAYPRNVTADGKTIEDVTANAACVGRQPIVCIMVRDKDNKIVSFAYMKFLITQEKSTPEAKEINFDIKDIWVNCKNVDGKVTWSQIEHDLLSETLGGMSKKDFDKSYVFDFYKEETQEVDQEGATYSKVIRYGIQYDDKLGVRINEADEFGTVAEEWNLSAQGEEDATTHIIKWSFTDEQLKDMAEALEAEGKLSDKDADGNTLDYYANTKEITTWVRYAHLNYTPIENAPKVGEEAEKGHPSIWVKLTIPVGEFHVAKGDMGANKILTFWYNLNSKTNATGTTDAFEVRVNVPVPVPEASASVKTIGYDWDDNDLLDIRYDNLLEGWEDDDNAETLTVRENNKFSEFTKNLKDFFIDGKLTATVKAAGHFDNITGMKLGCEFILPSKKKADGSGIGNATGFEAAADGTWTVNGYTGSVYTLKLNDDHTKILIVKVDGVGIDPVELVTLNYDSDDAATRQITVLNYVNGEYQDDILNYKTHNELDEKETFTAYINIKAVDACAPVYWDNMWFNVRFLRPLDLENPKQAVVPDAPNDWHPIDLTDALVVKDWREYYGDRQNRVQGKDVSVVIPSIGNVKAFDFAYYQVVLDITDNNFYTDANLGTSQRSDIFTLGHMPVIKDEADAKAKGFIKTTSVPNLMLEKTGKTTLRYLNNSGVTGGFHVFVPITMTYVYGYQTVRQTKWVTVGVTPSVEQAMIED